MARCGCSATEASGCQCSATVSECFDIEGAGSSANPFKVVARIDADTRNLIECNPSGIGAYLPPEIEDPPCCRITRGSGQTIPNNVATILFFELERFDTDSMHDNVTNNSRITFNTAGVYVVTGQVQWAANATRDRKIQIRLNSATVLSSAEDSPGQASDPFDQVVTTIWKFDAGDFVELIATQGSGGDLAVLKTTGSSPEFMATRTAVG